MAYSITTLLLGAALAYTIYYLLLVAYRLTFHPLAKFSGPKLAAATYLYEFYWDVLREGRFVWRIKDMHDRYGPIVRISPHEVHVRDPEFYQELYAPAGGGKLRNKYEWWCQTAAMPTSIFCTVDHETHRMRRAPLNNFFSRKAVGELEPLIASKVEKLCARFGRAAEAQQVVRADCAFMAVTMDVISTYCFGYDSAYLDQDSFGQAWKEMLNGAWSKGALMRAFPWLPYLMHRFPRKLAQAMDPQMAMMLQWQDSVKELVQPIVEGNDAVEKGSRHSIFHTLRDSDLPPSEKSLQRLCDEGEIFTGAGSETTARTLTLILFHLATSPECLAKLRIELDQIMPEARKLASWTQLSNLPYLSAIIQEGLRLSYGMTVRLPRIAPDPLQYGDFVIPPGTPTSQTPYLVLVEPTVFPDPEAFKPERWLGNAGLEKYQVAFNKGSRQCIGMNLAYAEMYLTTAATFRRFDFELFKTEYEDIRMEHDFFVAAPKDPHKGVKVKIMAR